MMNSNTQSQIKDTNCHLVFVYGTLRKGESNHHVLAGAKCVIELAWIEGTLYDTDQSYPALSLTPYGHVYGEIYEVGSDLMRTLDQLEGYVLGREGNLYERQVKEVMSNDGPFETYIYTVDHNRSLCKKRIDCGDWLGRS